MKPLDIARTRSANDAPLSIGHILDRGLATAQTQEIVYARSVRYTYRDALQRVRRLANALDALGVKPGRRWRSWTGTAIATWNVSSPCR